MTVGEAIADPGWRIPDRDAPGPLAGVRVLDFSRILAGPYATMILADLGAEVVKVEEPGEGDEARRVGPFADGASAYFISINRGKRSVTLNLRHPEGQRLAREMGRRADVLVENFRPGTMERLGLDYPVLRVLNPRLVYASCSGFGQTGPYRTRGAYDMIIQGMGGIVSVTGMPGGPPVRVGVSVGDLTGAFFTVIGILAALGVARTTGQGQLVDVGMLDCQVAILEHAIVRYTVAGEVPGPLGARHPSIAPFEIFPAADGDIVLAVGTRQWARFCEHLGRPDLAADPRFATNAQRAEHVEALRAILVEITRRKPVAAWLADMEAIGVPCGPVNRVDQVLADPQVQARGMVVEVEHRPGGKVRMAGTPMKLSATPAAVRGPAPNLGEHTEATLAGWLGLDGGTIAGLRAGGVI